MKRSSKEIALSAVACAFATIALTIGTLYSPMLFTGYLFAGICIMLPLSRGYFMGASLCFIASNVLTLLFNGFNFFDTLPFTAFFGLHPIVNELQQRLCGNKGKCTAYVAASRNTGANSSAEKSATDKSAACLTEEFVFDFSSSSDEEELKNTENKAGVGGTSAKKGGAFGNGRQIVLNGIFLLLKTVWFDFSMYFVWKIVFSAQTAVPFIDEHIALCIALGGSLFFIAYDWMLFRLRKNLNAIIRRILGNKR